MKNTKKNSKKNLNPSSEKSHKPTCLDEEHKQLLGEIDQIISKILSVFGKKIRQMSPISHNEMEARYSIGRKSELQSETSTHFLISTYLVKICAHLKALKVNLNLKIILGYILIATKQRGKIYITLVPHENDPNRRVFKHLIFEPKPTSKRNQEKVYKKEAQEIEKSYKVKRKEEKAQLEGQKIKLKEKKLLFEQKKKELAQKEGKLNEDMKVMEKEKRKFEKNKNKLEKEMKKNEEKRAKLLSMELNLKEREELCKEKEEAMKQWNQRKR